MLGVVEEDALEDWSEVLGGMCRRFLDFVRVRPIVPKLIVFSSDRAGEKVMEEDQVVT